MTNGNEFFTALQERIDPSDVKGLTATYQFHLSGDGGGDWYIQLTDGQPEVAEGIANAPSVTLRASAEDWNRIVSGELSGEQAFLSGKLEVEGDMTLAMKLQSLIGG
ncbi:MAG: SCP2 sterol-binding domain-containing protein [Candidatus Hydrogenedentota bacterium]